MLSPGYPVSPASTGNDLRRVRRWSPLRRLERRLPLLAISASSARGTRAKESRVVLLDRAKRRLVRAEITVHDHCTSNSIMFTGLTRTG
jgi:hypothetical protein